MFFSNCKPFDKLLQSFNQHLLSTYYKPNVVLDPEMKGKVTHSPWHRLRHHCLKNCFPGNFSYLRTHTRKARKEKKNWKRGRKLNKIQIKLFHPINWPQILFKTKVWSGKRQMCYDNWAMTANLLLFHVVTEHLMGRLCPLPEGRWLSCLFVCLNFHIGYPLNHGTDG